MLTAPQSAPSNGESRPSNEPARICLTGGRDCFGRGPYFSSRDGGHPMRSLLEDCASDESGATAIEYGLIAGLIALVVIGAMTNLSNVIWNKLNLVAGAL